MIIRVTQAHIDEGYRRNPWCCPVALAIRGAMAVEHGVRILSHGITFPGGSVSTPEKVLDFIDAFDDGQSVQPFEFDLPVQKGQTE